MTVSSSNEEIELINALRAGSESAFVKLIDTYHASMLRIAMLFARDPSLAEDIVQEAWVGVLHGLARFEARSSIKTWIFRILVNTAKSRATREQRTIPMSALWDRSSERFEPAVEPERFRPPDAPQYAGGWASFPLSWGDAPEEKLIAHETQMQIRAAIEALPANQRIVVSLRDAEGWTTEEIRNILQISDANQRVLLHRGRSKVRRSLERYLTGT